MDATQGPPSTTVTGSASMTDTGRIDRLMAPSEWRMGWSPQLDGLRAVATLSVMMVHYTSSFGDSFEGLSISVDLFFAMSGFLITTLLFAEFDKRGTISLKKFLIRRALRLIPALVVLLAVFSAFALLAGGDDRSHYMAEVVAVLFYVYNFFVAWSGVEGQALIQLWTLSIEQQFYVSWPIVLTVIAIPRGGRAIRRRSIGVLLWVMAMFVVALPVLRMTLPHDLGARTFSSFVFGLSIMRPDAIVLGCLAAFVMRVWPKRGPSRIESFLSTLGSIAVGVILLVCVAGPIVEALAARIPAVDAVTWLFVPRYVSPIYNLAVVAAAVFVFDLVRNPDKPAARLLRTRPLVWLGERSYATYIWHLLIYFILKDVFAGMLPGRTRLVDIVTLPFAYVVTILVAMASWRFVEEPALRLKSRFGA